jgi:hypothetical protein
VDCVVVGLLEVWIVLLVVNHQQHNPLLYETTNNTIHSSIKPPTTQSPPLANHQQHNPLLYQTTNNTIHSYRGVDCVVVGLLEEWIVLLVV